MKTKIKILKLLFSEEYLNQTINKTKKIQKKNETLLDTKEREKEKIF
jgi:hypothetical protein